VKQRTEYGRGWWHPDLVPFDKEPTMSDNLQDRGQQDRARINLHEKHEIQYWTKALGVSQEELEQAVQKAGNSAEAVRQHLRTRH
jgi:hypothetical protein